MKLCGGACLASAALCVLVTVATTVVHMSRLQSLSQCHYQQRTQTCTCYSAVLDERGHETDDGESREATMTGLFEPERGITGWVGMG